jgi:hypothetical protein
MAMKALLTKNIAIEMPQQCSKHQSLFIELLNLVYRKKMKEKMIQAKYTGISWMQQEGS